MYKMDVEKFARMVREKRGERTIREVAVETEISPSTLSRVENRKTPDRHNFMLLCLWLDVSPAEFFLSVDSELKDEGEGDLTTLLRAAKHLSPETTSALMEAIRVVYDQMYGRTNEAERA